jgi:SAM-dependent methyltransferase
MGDTNQLKFVENHCDELEGPFLEVGSKDYGSTQDLRRIFASKGEYVGVDMSSGPGVDIVLDMTSDFAVIDKALKSVRFGTIFCLSVLEHCHRPFHMAENLVSLLKPGGTLVLSAPFCWKIHGYPNDYWRFTPEGIKQLFSGIHFIDKWCVAATSRTGEFLPIDQDLTKITFSFRAHRESGHFLRAVSAKTMKVLASAGLFTWLAGYRYVYPPTNIFMIGKRDG